MMRFLLLLLAIITFNDSRTLAQSTPYPLNKIGLSTTINTVIDQDIFLSDQFDKTINLNDLIRNKPTIITFVYLNCPLLCHLLLDGLSDAITESTYKLSSDFQVISISIDPSEKNETLRAYQKKYLDELNQPNGWQFLKGDASNIKKLTNAFGYHYQYIKRTKDYAHPSVIFFYNNKITNYLEGVTFEKAHFNYSLMNTKTDKSIKEKIMTFCYYFDPDNQTYTLLIFKILRLLSLLTVIILSILIITFIRRDKKEKNHGKHRKLN